MTTTTRRLGLQAGDGLEVGAGTGQLTGALLDAGWAVDALEPSTPMAARLMERYAGEITTGRLAVVDEPFESFTGASSRRFDAIWSADAWHWVEPTVGYRRAAQLLKPSGRLIAIWTMAGLVEDPATARQLNEIYEELSPDLVRDPGSPIDESVLVAGRDEINASEVMAVSDHWIEGERRQIDHSTYVAWQLSYAHIADMADAERNRLSDAIAAALRSAADGVPIRVRLLRYIVASRRVDD